MRFIPLSMTIMVLNFLDRTNIVRHCLNITNGIAHRALLFFYVSQYPDREMQGY